MVKLIIQVVMMDLETISFCDSNTETDKNDNDNGIIPDTNTGSIDWNAPFIFSAPLLVLDLMSGLILIMIHGFR